MGVALAGSLMFAEHPVAEGDKQFTMEVPRAIPASLWQTTVPDGRPLTHEKVALGRQLFFDPRLSHDGTVSCATCHDPKKAFTDGKRVSVGVGGRTGTRNAPTILNAMFSDAQFWDGRAATLEAQAKQPLVNPVEMAMESHEAVERKVAAIPSYAEQFQRVFGGKVTIDRLAEAIASFERTQLSGDAPFDRFLAGDEEALSEAAQRGWDLFRGRALCATCHVFVQDSSPFFTDFQFHNTGIGVRNVTNFEERAEKIRRLAERGELTEERMDELALTNEELSEMGRFVVTRQRQDIGAFKTPTLRDVELTAPYFHDGSIKTLREVMEFYNEGGHDNSYLDSRMRPLNLTDRELEDLVELMKALTSDRIQNLSREHV